MQLGLRLKGALPQTLKVLRNVLSNDHNYTAKISWTRSKGLARGLDLNCGSLIEHV